MDYYPTLDHVYEYFKPPFLQDKDMPRHEVQRAYFIEGFRVGMQISAEALIQD